jgi:phosphoribosylformylglycinamidine synthase PurS subunit
MPRVVVSVMPKLGFDGISDVRQGKRFELEVEGELTDARLHEIHDLAEKLLSNPVIEDFTVVVHEDTLEDAGA